MLIASRLLTRLLAVVVGLLVLVLVALGGLAWRLNQGPLEITALLRHVLPHVDPAVTVGYASLTLERLGDDRVVRIALRDAMRAGEAERPADTVRSGTVALALSPLLVGALRPQEVEVSGLRLHVRRAGSDKPGDDPAALLARLRHVAVSDAQVWVADAVLGQTWQVAEASVALDRQPDGSLAGTGGGLATIADVSARLALDGRYSPDAATLRMTVSPLSPASLGRAVPQLAALQALDAAVGVQVVASFGPGLTPLRASVHAESGPGTAQIPAKGGGTSPAKFASMALDADGSPSHATLQRLRVVLASPSGGSSTTVVLSGEASRADGRFQARVNIDLDHAAFADLPTLWPERVGGNARAWLTSNLTAGTVHDGHVTFALSGTKAGDIDITEGGGSLTGEDVTAWWLRPVPPLEHGRAVVTWQNADVLTIAVTGARQGKLTVNAGTVRITGLSVHDQVAAIDADIAGGLGELFTLLHHPRLGLLSKHPVPVTAPSGAVTAHLSVQLPLESKVSVDQVRVHATGQVANAHLGAVAAGRDLDRGQLGFDVTNDGLSVTGAAQLDHIPGKLALEMDFRTGGPSQVVQHAAVTMRVGEREAKAAGLAAIGLDAGIMAASLDYAERRDGGATIRVSADLREAGFKTPLGWSKAVGTPGHAEARALLSHGALIGLDGLRAEAPGLAIHARTDLVQGAPALVHLERGEIGRSSATGTIALPQRPGEPYRVSLSGPRLDLEGPLKTQGAAPASAPSRTGGTPYAVDLHFQEVVFGNGRSLGPVSLTARGAGGRLEAARLATTGPERVQVDLVPNGPERKIWATAANLGLLLHNTDLLSEITGGTMILNGIFDDRLPSSPFNGTLDLRNFQVRGAPIIGKVLQGMTLYGVVDALRGPGLVFDHLATGFRLDGAVLDVTDARAYSSSLGVTATGRLDFTRRQVDLKGTIVPAYFFNALPGKVPLLGRLFSPEKGSGLFAATFGLHGPLQDPGVAINPLSALTPGFTRRLFDLFD